MDNWKNKTTNHRNESLIGFNRFQKKALKTIIKYYPEFRLEPSPSPQTTEGVENGEKMTILTGKYNITGIFVAILLTLCNIILLILRSFIDRQLTYEEGKLTALVFSSVIIGVLFGIDGWSIIYALLAKHFFIILNFQGIYYKKILIPRRIAWSDISKITATKKYDRIVIMIYWKPKSYIANSERFDSRQFRGTLWRKKTSPQFAEAFKLCRYRQCPFIEYDLHARYRTRT